MLTTNWDTLLERAAADNTVDYSYEVVRAAADLTYAKSPRIVKLHGTVGDAGPLIFAEEDYRTYPVKHAAFVNFARQVFIENELCLIGFSGDDPNFLQWAGWVRDHLGGSARRIYLVGYLNLERATRRYLEAHNIAPIDLAPLVKDLAPALQHAVATRIFIDELRKAKPPLRHKWQLTPSNQFPLPGAGPDAYQRLHKDHAFAAELLKKTVPLFKADRESYPGWLVCPIKHRQTLRYAGDSGWLLRKPVLDLLEPKLRAEALFEILWRHTASFSPIDVQLANALTDLVKAKPPEVDAGMRQEFALALMRDARVSCDDNGMKRWGAVLEAETAPDSVLRQEAEYQWCFRARDRMDLATLAARLARITSEDPIWKLRRAALHSEIGEYATATKLVKDATAELERRHRLDRNSLPIKSQLAWAGWLRRAAAAWSTKWDDLPQPRDFRELDIDPLHEIEYVENQAEEIAKKRRDDAVAIRPAFEAGHYRDGSNTIHIGSGDPGIILLYEFDQLIERSDLPLRINNVNVCADTAIAAVEVAQQPNVEWRVWLLRALHDHLDRPFERHFSRVAIARMPAATSSELIAIVEAAVAFWVRRFKETRRPDLQSDFSRAVDALRLSLMALSRMTQRMAPDQAANTLHRATEMANDPQFSHMWLIEALGELAKHAAKAVPTAQQGTLALSILEFPLPSEKGGAFPVWPRIITDIWNAEPIRDPAETRWDHRVHQLIAATQKGHADREHAILRLAYLAMRNALKPNEAAAFGKALWSDADAQENALPQNTGLTASALLQLPADGIDVRARLGARLFSADLREVMKMPSPTGTVAIRSSVDHLNSLTKAAEFGLTLPAAVAVRMFDEIVVWEQQTPDRTDPFAISFVNGFNDSMRLAAGHLLAAAVVPALEAGQRTEQRARYLMAFVTRTRSWTGLEALPLFLSSAEATRDHIISMIRRGLIGSESQHVGSAALAVRRWANLVRNGTVPELPRSLVEQLIAMIETCREVGLSAMLEAARTLLNGNFLLEQDLKRLMEALSMIRSEFRYETVDFDTLRAVSVSLVRAASVRLAAALKGRVADDGTLQGWEDHAKCDPLPEVRFALTDD
ncbi:MAG: SIR2 family protein [Xanthobacteraceae bacterium]